LDDRVDDGENAVSRLDSLSSNALATLFAQESTTPIIVLLTISGTGIATPVRLCDQFLERLSETSEEVVYGLTSNGNDFYYLPFNLSLPTEEFANAPRCTLTLNDVTRYLIPTIRNISTPPSVQIDIILASDPDTVEITFGGFVMTNIRYNANSITADLVIESLEIEPFPAHSFTPSYFPGLF
jgi:hypothetical protein